MRNIIIPRPLHIVLDDMGWMSGKDDRENGGPSRLGIKRQPCYKDYLAINELGKRIGMKITCAFVLGEWDPDNRLGSIRGLSKYKENWNNAAYLNREELARCIDTVKKCEYIDLAVHGLLHGYYIEGTDNTDESDFYYHKNDRLFMVDEAEIRARLDAYFDLLKFYGIDKKITTFVPPSFSYRFNELSEILKSYGIKYVSTIFENMENRADREIADVEQNGIINIDRNLNPIEWDEFASDFSKLPQNITGVLGIHWPNLLSEDENQNGEVISRAAEFFLRCSESFGTILSRNIEFCANQSLFYRFAKAEQNESETVIDIGTLDMNKTYYISSKERVRSVSGADICVFEEKQSFITYALTPKAEKIILK